MIAFEDIEPSTDSGIAAECEDWIISYRSHPYKRHNSLHLDLAMGRGKTVPEMRETYDQFWEEFYHITELKTQKVSHWAYLFMLNKKMKLWPHVHCVVYSTKDASTGRSVGRLPITIKNKLIPAPHQIVRCFRTDHTGHNYAIIEQRGLLERRGKAADGEGT